VVVGADVGGGAGGELVGAGVVGAAALAPGDGAVVAESAGSTGVDSPSLGSQAASNTPHVSSTTTRFMTGR